MRLLCLLLSVIAGLLPAHAEMVARTTQEAIVGVAEEPELLGPVENENNTPLSMEEAVDRSEAYGVRQTVKDLVEEQEQALQRLLETDSYMYETVFQDESYKEVKSHCRNLDALCTYWAVVGYCEENPEYMMVGCAPACFSCEELDVEAVREEEANAAAAAAAATTTTASSEEQGSKVEKKAFYTFHDYYVAGRNLATFGLKAEDANSTNEKDEDDNDSDEPPFELFEDYDIGHLIRGNESWEELKEYRRLAEHRTLSFYGDKVARKRWLPTQGINQAKLHFAAYFKEFHQGDDEICSKIIFEHLPNKTDFIAKPSHLSGSKGINIVNYDEAKDMNRFRILHDTSKMLKSNHTMRDVAKHLATYGKRSDTLSDGRSRALAIVHPGIIIEELFTHPDNVDMPPMEMYIMVVWGRVFAGQYNDFLTIGTETDRYGYSYIYRNGSMADVGKLEGTRNLPDYIDWPQMVQMAEKLGANKDMARIDIFAGLPASFRKNATVEERRAAVQYAYNEMTTNPLNWIWPGLDEEIARLWIAGYKMGNYKVVPNTEVPTEWLQTDGYYYGSADSE